MLADKPCIHVVVQWNNADGLVFEVYFAVDAGLSSGINNLILRQVDPWVIIFLF